jgi:hypothetical protein
MFGFVMVLKVLDKWSRLETATSSKKYLWLVDSISGPKVKNC